jgi:hypothetical protein
VNLILKKQAKDLTNLVISPAAVPYSAGGASN